jgi:TIR domain
VLDCGRNCSRRLSFVAGAVTMGYVPGFTNDIFISYSHIDDQAVDGRGWVTDFHRRVAIEVEQNLGAKVEIWRDKRITGATDFTRDLDKQVRGSAVLLAILSPGYVNCRWCDWELTGFARSRRVGDLWVDTKCRAIKIFKRPADVTGLRVLTETEGVKFFDVDAATNISYEMEASAALFKQRLTELGHDIGDVLRAMRKARTVFLGAASRSLRDQRERVREELKGRNYRVLTAPDGPLDDRQRAVRGAIRESAMSVLFYDRAAPAGHTAEDLAALGRRVAMDQQARLIIVVRGQPDLSLQPWDEPEAAGRGGGQSRMADRTADTYALPHPDARDPAGCDIAGPGASARKRLVTATRSSRRSRARAGGRRKISRIRSCLSRVR